MIVNPEFEKTAKVPACFLIALPKTETTQREKKEIVSNQGKGAGLSI